VLAPMFWRWADPKLGALWGGTCTGFGPVRHLEAAGGVRRIRPNKEYFTEEKTKDKYNNYVLFFFLSYKYSSPLLY
jgi:hypothetical protein